MLIFFNNINHLTDAYQYIVVHTNQHFGATQPLIVMYHLITDPTIKQTVIENLADKDGNIKIVLCSSSLSMGMNMAMIDCVIHYGPPTTADAFFQETGRAAREPSRHAHSILLTFPRMASGRKLDNTMKMYCLGVECRRVTLLGKFGCTKPLDQTQCCDVCEEIPNPVKTAICDSFQSSVTDSFTDSDSLASAGELEDLDIWYDFKPKHLYCNCIYLPFLQYVTYVNN